MVNVFNYMDNFIFVISLNRKIKFTNKAVMNKIKINLKDIIDTPVKDCLYTNGKSINNLIDGMGKDEDINFDFYLQIYNKKFEFNGDLFEGNFYEEKSYFIVARDLCEKYYSRSDLETLLDNINLSCFIKNKKGEYLYANKRKCDFHKKTKKEIIGCRANDLYDNVQELGYIENVENELIKRKEPFSTENVFTVDGEKKWYEVTLSPTLNEDKSVKNINITSRNIDIRKHLDKTLDYISIKLREINESINKGEDIYNNNLMNLLNYISEKIINNFKSDGVAISLYNKDENDFSILIGKGVIVDDFTITERKETTTAVHLKYTQKCKLEGIKYVDEIENEMVTRKLKEKNIYKIGIYNITVKDELLGHVVITFLQDTKSIEFGYDYIKTICSHLAVTISNINESIKIKNELKEYKQKKDYLQKCIEISVDIIGKFDKNGNLVYINEDRLKGILGWSAKEFEELEQIKKHFGDKKMVNQDSGSVYENFDFENDLIVHYESKVLCKNGEYKWLEWNIKNYYDEETLFFTARDITSKKEYQKNGKLLEQAVEMEDLKNRFFNNLSHEFKTPINIILGIVQLIEQSRSNNNYILDNLDFHINIVKRNSYRLLRLVQNLLDLSQVKSQYYDMNFGNYDIVEIVEDIVMSVATYLKNKNINLIFDTNCEEQIISCDPEKIERIVLNLLSNAIKYNKDDNDIEVYMNVSKSFVKIYIKDYGIGIEAHELENIFEEFIKLDDGLTRLCEGSGIGLSIVNEFTRIHKGEVRVFSELGRGTTFEVILPNKINNTANGNIKNNKNIQNKMERCNIEFSDIYN